jgi:hypothetical protein
MVKIFKQNKPVVILCCIVLIIIFFQCNPFAPTIETEDQSSNSLTGDQKTIEGLFLNFKYAYAFKDTTLYGKLLTDDFTFIYRDYDQGVDISWGRDEEMQITDRLFQNSQTLDLIWNNIFSTSGDSTLINVIRFFNLSITFNPSDIMTIDGKVNLTLERASSDEVWKIKSWRDESDY